MTRVATVTGGAGAIGGAIVAGLRAAGHEVVILDRDGDPPVDLAETDAVRAAAAGVRSVSTDAAMSWSTRLRRSTGRRCPTWTQAHGAACRP